MSIHQPKHIVVVAGEESGDVHAAHFIANLRRDYPHIKCSGIGGRHMEAAGMEILFNLADHGVTGVTEVIRQFSIIKQAFNCIKEHLKNTQPDLLILVDYPGFNLRLAHYVKKHFNIPIIYYISPQIWAWKAGRIATIRANIDHMAVILPFEQDIYQKAGVPVSFVGHPLVKKIDNLPTQDQRQHLGLPFNRRIIALLPGSRKNEIKKLMPVLAHLAQLLRTRIQDVHFALPIAQTLDPELVKAYLPADNFPITYIMDQALATVSCAEFVIVASGTASLECALLKKPMAIIYRISRLTYAAAMKLVKVRYIGLCNILHNKMLVPEFVQDDCSAEHIADFVTEVLQTPALAKSIINQLEQMKCELSAAHANNSLENLIIQHLA